AATAYVTDNAPATPEVLAQAAIQSYQTAYLWGAGFFAIGAVTAALLFRRRNQGLALHHTPEASAEPVLAH
ncbi:MAG: MFS transporter, partial [Plantibacter flavus]